MLGVLNSAIVPINSIYYSFKHAFQFILIVVMIVIRMGFQKDIFYCNKDIVLLCVVMFLFIMCYILDVNKIGF